MDNSGTKRGLLIVLEGGDRSGKSTQARLLQEWLRKEKEISCEIWQFPDRTLPSGQVIDSYLKSSRDLDDHAIHLMYSANRWEKNDLMLEKLSGGTTLILDRYSFSGVAYTAAKGIDKDWCAYPEIGLPGPDLVLYFDVSLESAQRRSGFGEERYEKESFAAKVKVVFESILLLPEDKKWTSGIGCAASINADLGMEDVFNIAKSHVQTALDGERVSRSLWE
jgi:dTMP kinase